MESKISVLMSVYNRENPDFLSKALYSIVNQTLRPAEIILVIDGPIGDQLQSAIDQFGQEHSEFRTVPLAKSHKLGLALAIGMENCSNELIARMDSDDISRPDRFEKQARYLNEHPEIAAVGGNIDEFVEERVILRTKRMKTDPADVREYGKYRNPINHMTVMFRKSCVMDAGGYRDYVGLEDYDLWIRMTAKGYMLANIDETLVEARLGDHFEERRGGKEYFRRYRKLRKQQHDLGYTSAREYVKVLIYTYGMTRMPGFLRRYAYKRLRKG